MMQYLKIYESIWAVIVLKYGQLLYLETGI